MDIRDLKSAMLDEVLEFCEEEVNICAFAEETFAKMHEYKALLYRLEKENTDGNGEGLLLD